MDKIEFLTRLAKGINPITGERCRDDEVLRNPDVVSGIYDIILDLQVSNVKKAKQKFIYDSRMAALIEVIEPNTTIMPFAKQIEKIISLGFTVIQRSISNYLLAEGMLEMRKAYAEDGESRNYKYATSLGEQLGIINDFYSSPGGKQYHRILYNVNAQRYIIDNLGDILTDEYMKVEK